MDKLVDITQGPGEICEILHPRRQGHMPEIHDDEEELNLLFPEPELGGRCAKEYLAAKEGLLEANPLHPAEHNDDEL